MAAAIEPQGVSSFTGQLHAIEQSIPGSRKRGHVGHPGGRPRAIALSAPQSADMPQHGQLRSLAAEIPQGSPRCGISRATIASALDDMTMDPGVIARDRKQGFFAQSFLAFSDKLISQNRIQNGIARLKQHRDLFAKVEKQYGVPGPVIAAFWALESDYGPCSASCPSCARSRHWPTIAGARRCSETELMDAMRIIDRGDLRPRR